MNSVIPDCGRSFILGIHLWTRMMPPSLVFFLLFCLPCCLPQGFHCRCGEISGITCMVIIIIIIIIIIYPKNSF